MPNRFNIVALRHKLLWIFALVLVCTLTFSFAAMLALQYLNVRSDMVTQLSITAALTADSVASALRAEDPRRAADMIKHVAINPGVRNVTILKLDNKPFTDYQRPGEARMPAHHPEKLLAQVGADGFQESRELRAFHHFENDSLEVLLPVLSNGRRIGTVYINSDLTGLRAKARQAILLAIGVNLPCILISVLFVRRLVNAVSAPITNLADTATAVALAHDYSLRAEKTSNDELGQLVDAFNEMMAKIEYQSDRLSEQHEKLARSDRMESLGILAGGVAHDLNNILGPMVAFPDMIAERLSPDDPSLEEIKMIGHSAKRASVVIQDLLSLARRGNYHLQVTNLNALLEDCLQSPAFKARAQDHADIKITTALKEDLPPISGSEPHLTQAILNLLFNGLEAMGHRGSLVISSRVEKLLSAGGSFERIEPGTYVVMSIADTGIGIPAAEIEHIFEPFYSRKKMGLKSGSGLGLAVVYGVIKDHEAVIDVTSTVGKGTNFEIYFKALAIPMKEPCEPAKPSRGTERILVVDDYPQQRILTERILQMQGYATFGAKNGREAVRLLHEEEFDLMVLDMIMEDDFDGLDTYRECVRIHPGIKCVIATGFSENERVKQALSLGASQCLHKPYTPTALGAAVRHAIDGAAAAAPATPECV